MDDSFTIKDTDVMPVKGAVGDARCVRMANSLKSLQIGQHFDIPISLRKHLSWYSWIHRKRNPLTQFVTRTMPDESNSPVVRCFRIEDLEKPLPNPIGFTTEIKEKLRTLVLGEKLFVPYSNFDEIKEYIDANSPGDWTGYIETRMIQRRRVRGYWVWKKSDVLLSVE